MRENDRSIVGLVMVGHAMVHTFEMSIPIFLTIWITRYGVTEAVLGVVVTVGYGLFGAGALPGGVLADRFSSHKLIGLSLLGMGASFLVLGVGTTLPGVDGSALGVPVAILVIAFALVCWGLSASVYHPSGLSLISTGVQARGRGFAFHGIAGNLGIALGPLATILLLEVFEWEQVAAALAAPALLGAVVVARLDIDERAAVEEDEGRGTPGVDAEDGLIDAMRSVLAASSRLATPAFVGIFLLVILSGLVYRGVLTFLPEVLGNLSPLDALGASGEVDAARYAYVGILVVGVVGQYVGGRLSDVVHPAVGLAGAFSLLAVVVALFLPAAAVGTMALLVVAVLLGVLLFVVQPLYQAAVAEHTPADLRGISYGYTYLGVFGVGAAGGAVAGWFLTYSTAAVLFTVLAGGAGLAAVLGVTVARYGQRVE